MDAAARGGDRDLMVDGNAVGGLLQEIFAQEMTPSPAACDHCGNVGELGTLLAFVQGPGTVLRCPGCENVMVRIVVTPGSIYLDTRGTAYLRLARATP
jgi:hypothetical protein